MSNTAEQTPASQPQSPTKGRLKSVLRVCGVLFGMFWFGTGLVEGDPFLHDLPLQLLFGWIGFLSRTAERMQASWDGIVFGVGLIAALIVSLKVLMSRFRQHSLSWSRSTGVVGLIVILFVSGTAFTGLCRHTVWLTTTRFPWTDDFRGSARKQMSKNNLKQLALAAMNYHQEHQVLPPGGTFDRNGTGQHSWITHLLPYLDEHARYRRIDLAQPWHAPVNAPVMREQLNVVVNHGLHVYHDEQHFALSHYTGNSHLFGANRSRSYGQITDGLSQTILAGEIREGFRPWGDPLNWRDPARPVNTRGAFGSPTIGRVHVVFADGSVRFLSPSISPKVLKALSTPDGGEKLPPDF